MENSATTEILVEMQKTEPTGTEERSCRKVSFAAPALHRLRPHLGARSISDRSGLYTS